VDEGPLKNVDLAVHENNLHVIMKEGSLYKDHSETAVIENVPATVS
jgi:hypothetical protein